MINKTILWLEDDIDLIGAVIKPLRDIGIRIIECRSYKEAIAQIKDIKKIDLILLDLIIPSGENFSEGQFLGLEFLHRLRHEFEIDIPVIVFSVISHRIDISNELKKLNAIPVRKPIRPSQLKIEVMDILNLPYEN